METAVFAQTPGSDSWQLYELDETGRAALPLDKKTDDETFAVGMALDMTSQEEVVISKCSAFTEGHQHSNHHMYNACCTESI